MGNTGTTVSTELVDDGGRRGRQGRTFVAPQRRRELLAAFEASGLTRAEFARREGVKYTTLCNWVQHEQVAKAPSEVVRFAEVSQPAGDARGLEVRLADGTTLRGERVEELAALARALRS